MIPRVLPTLVTGYGSVNLREGVPQFMLGLGVSHLPVKSALDIGMGDSLEAFRQ